MEGTHGTESPSYEWRPFVAEDEADLERMYRKLMRHTHTLTSIASLIPSVNKRKMLAHGDVFVLASPRGPEGYVKYRTETQEGKPVIKVTNIWINEKDRGKPSVVRGLMRLPIDACTNAGAHAVIGEVIASNTYVRTMYEKLTDTVSHDGIFSTYTIPVENLGKYA
jgi:hypothetical protein